MFSNKETTLSAITEPKSDVPHRIVHSNNLKIALSPRPSAVAHFNEMPECGYVRLPVVLALLGCSKSTLWRHVKSSHVPSPKKLGNRISVWQVGTLRAYLKYLESSGVYVSKEGGK